LYFSAPLLPRPIGKSRLRTQQTEQAQVLTRSIFFRATIQGFAKLQNNYQSIKFLLFVKKVQYFDYQKFSPETF